MSDPKTITTPDEKEPMVMHLGKNGWRDMATVERRDEIKDKREQLRRKAKETL